MIFWAMPRHFTVSQNRQYVYTFIPFRRAAVPQETTASPSRYGMHTAVCLYSMMETDAVRQAASVQRQAPFDGPSDRLPTGTQQKMRTTTGTSSRSSMHLSMHFTSVLRSLSICACFRPIRRAKRQPSRRGGGNDQIIAQYSIPYTIPRRPAVPGGCGQPGKSRSPFQGRCCRRK